MRTKQINITQGTYGYQLSHWNKGRRVVLSARTPSGFYRTSESAKRAWRRYASVNNISNYIYNVQG